MWPFKKKQDDEEDEQDEVAKKVTAQIDKLVMGVIIGGAIGSVLGLTLAPKKGKETRKYLKEKSKAAIDFVKEVRTEVRKSLNEGNNIEKKGWLQMLFGKSKRKKK